MITLGDVYTIPDQSIVTQLVVITLGMFAYVLVVAVIVYVTHFFKKIIKI